jgi:DNA-binding IclR family transcriptional regulator
MKHRTGGEEGFVMVQFDGLRMARDLVREGRLQHRDLQVLITLMAEVDWRTGRVPLLVGEIAELSGLHRCTTSSCMARLKREMLVVRCQEATGSGSYFLLNPDLANVGGERRRDLLRQAFRMAFN